MSDDDTEPYDGGIPYLPLFPLSLPRPFLSSLQLTKYVDPFRYMISYTSQEG